MQAWPSGRPSGFCFNSTGHPAFVHTRAHTHLLFPKLECLFISDSLESMNRKRESKDDGQSGE